MARGMLDRNRGKHWIKNNNSYLEELKARTHELIMAIEYNKGVRRLEGDFNARFGPSLSNLAQLEAHKDSIEQFYAAQNNVRVPGLLDKLTTSTNMVGKVVGYAGSAANDALAYASAHVAKGLVYAAMAANRAYSSIPGMPKLTSGRAMSFGFMSAVALASLPGCGDNVSRDDYDKLQGEHTQLQGLSTKTSQDAGEKEAELDARIKELEAEAQKNITRDEMEELLKAQTDDINSGITGLEKDIAEVKVGVAVVREDFKGLETSLEDIYGKTNNLKTTLTHFKQSVEEYQTQASAERANIIPQIQTNYNNIVSAFDAYKREVGEPNKARIDALQTSVDELGEELRDFIADYRTNRNADLSNLTGRLAALDARVQKIVIGAATQPTALSYTAERPEQIYDAANYMMGKRILIEMHNWNSALFRDVFGLNIPSHWIDNDSDNLELRDSRALLIRKDHVSGTAQASFYLRGQGGEPRDPIPFRNLDYGKVLDWERNYFNASASNERRARDVTILLPRSPHFTAP